uniref:H15 domain-containing protein n=1 Tax=Eptatretus burgeri TaxID=7764 RepID=A0A8C4WRA4_EPTBU
MPETVPLSTEASPSPSKRAKTKTVSSRTTKKPDGTLSDKILKVVGSSKDRKGLSLIALKKALGADGYDVHRKAVHINAAVRRLVSNGKLVQTKGTGAAGSFKLNKDESAQMKKSARVKSTSSRRLAKTPTKAKAAEKTTKKPLMLLPLRGRKGRKKTQKANKQFFYFIN